MTFYERLLVETEPQRREFVSIPLIREVLARGASRELYLAYLEQAYHHVKHTCNLLALAAARCGPGDRKYQDALFEYIEEEKGHQLWILDDIRALSGDAEVVADGEPDAPCAVMVGYAYYAIEHVSPYSLLGMVHVLEEMSVLLARAAAASIAESLGRDSEGAGVGYLVSHGSLDEEHVAKFRGLVDTIDDETVRKTIIDTTRIMYGLFGEIFRTLGRRTEEAEDAA